MPNVFGGRDPIIGTAPTRRAAPPASRSDDTPAPRTPDGDGPGKDDRPDRTPIPWTRYLGELLGFVMVPLLARPDPVGPGDDHARGRIRLSYPLSWPDRVASAGTLRLYGGCLAGLIAGAVLRPDPASAADDRLWHSGLITAACVVFAWLPCPRAGEPVERKSARGEVILASVALIASALTFGLGHGLLFGVLPHLASAHGLLIGLVFAPAVSLPAAYCYMLGTAAIVPPLAAIRRGAAAIATPARRLHRFAFRWGVRRRFRWGTGRLTPLFAGGTAALIVFLVGTVVPFLGLTAPCLAA